MIYAGTVIKIEETIDGTPSYSVASLNGAIYFPCFVASIGGGYDAKYGLPPIDIGSEVIVARVNRGSVFYILGGIPDPQDIDEVDISESSNPDMESDYKKLHRDETILKNTKTRLLMSPTHDFVVDSPNMRLQLGSGILRISKQGSADNKLLNGQPFLDTLFDYIAELERTIIELKLAVTGSVSFPKAGAKKEECEAHLNPNIKVP